MVFRKVLGHEDGALKNEIGALTMEIPGRAPTFFRVRPQWEEACGEVGMHPYHWIYPSLHVGLFSLQNLEELISAFYELLSVLGILL